jgi:hypothetical protein
VTLADRDSLTANVDLEAPYGPINAFDASLVIQRRIGRRSHFPVQEDSSANHPQPETDDSVPRRLAVGRTLTSVLGPGWVSLRLEDRSHIVAGDLVIDGLMRPTAVYAADDLPGALVATNEVPGSLRIAFAAEAPAEGPGELLRIKLPGDAIPVSVHVEGDFNGGRLPALSQVAQSGSTNPRSLRLYPNHPNPFNAQTAIRFDLPAAAHVQLRIYNGLGQRVRTLLDGPMRSGVHSVVWDGTDDRRRHLSSGTYVSVLQAPDGRRTHTLLLVK